MKVISDSQVFEYLVKNLNKTLLVQSQIPLIIDALKTYQKDLTYVPERTVAVSNTEHSDLTHLFMPCILPNNVGLKVVTGGPTNTQKGLGFQGVINVLDEYSGELKAVVNAKTVTAYRTALATISALVRVIDVELDEPVEVLVFGAGPQAFWHVYLTMKLYNVRAITIISRSFQSAERLVSDLSEHFNATMRPVKLGDNESVAQLVSTSDIIFGCTPSTDGIIRKDFIGRERGVRKFLGLIGSYKPHMCELDLEFLNEFYKDCDTSILCDSKSLCLAEAGEIIQCGIDSLRLTPIADLPAGLLPEKFIAKNGMVLCKMVGLLAEDIVIAKFLSQNVDGISIPNF